MADDIGGKQTGEEHEQDQSHDAQPRNVAAMRDVTGRHIAENPVETDEEGL